MRFAISITHNFLLEPFMKTMGVSREDSFIEVDKETLHVRMGRWFDEKIPVARIKAIAPSDWPWWGGLGVKLGHHGVGVVGSMDHIVNIKFSEEIRVRVLFEVGVEQMWVSLEDRDGFLRALADATGVTVSTHTPF